MRHRHFDIQGLLLGTFLPIVVVVAMTLGILVYNRLYAVILEGFDRKLVTVTALTGALIDPVDHEQLVAGLEQGEDPRKLEDSVPYRRNVAPMRRVVDALGLTYLYSQRLGGSHDIVYVLDAATGQNHSLIGTEDVSTDEVRKGLEAVQTQGAVFVSPIEYQAQWGLSKASAAPIRSPEGRIVASAGADVDISIINIATQNALLASAIVGILSMVACAIAGIAVIGRVARPVETLKLEALRIASGDHAPPSSQDAPGEVQRLREGVATIADRLSSMLSSARRRSAEIEHQRLMRTLEENLSADAGPAFVLRGQGWLLAAIADEQTSRLAQSFWRRGIQRIAERLAAEPVDVLLIALTGQDGQFLVLDEDSGRLAVCGRLPVTLCIGDEVRLLQPGDAIQLSPGQQVTTRPAYLAATFGWNPPETPGQGETP